MFVSCVLLVTIFSVRDGACHDVVTSINGFYFILIDVGHHLGVGRVSQSVTLHWFDVHAGQLEDDLAARMRTLLRRCYLSACLHQSSGSRGAVISECTRVFSCEGRGKDVVVEVRIVVLFNVLHHVKGVLHDLGAVEDDSCVGEWFQPVDGGSPAVSCRFV